MYAANIAADNVPIADSVVDSLGELQASLLRSYFGNEATRLSMRDVLTLFGRQAEQARSEGLQGLAMVTDLAIDRLIPFEGQPLSDMLSAHLEDWVQLNRRYLNDPGFEAHAQALIDYLDNADWRDPLTEGQRIMLNRLFEISTPDTENLTRRMARIDATQVTGDVSDEAVILDAIGDAVISEVAISEVVNDNDDTVQYPRIDPRQMAALHEDLNAIADAELMVEIKTEDIQTEDIKAGVIQEAIQDDAIDAPRNVSQGMTDLVTMIREELQSSIDVLHSSLEKAALSALMSEPIALEDYRWQVERLANATESLGLTGLNDWLLRVLESACLLESALPQEVPSYCEVLDRWPTLVSSYLKHIGGEQASLALVQYITAPDFPLPIERDAAALLLEQLRTPNLDVPGGPAAARVETATAEMVSLQVPEDVSQELLDSLLHELPTQTQELSELLQKIASSTMTNTMAHASASNQFGDDVMLAQRIAHTLKGSANTAGIRGIAEIAHHLEDIFVALQDHHGVNPRLARTLVDAADCLEAMTEALQGMSSEPEQALSVLQDVLDWANRIDREGAEIATADDAELPTTINEQIDSEWLPVNASAAESSAASADRPFGEALVEVTQVEESHIDVPHVEVAAIPTLRIATVHIDDLLRLAGESKIIGSQLKEGLRRADSQLLAVRRQNQMLQQLVNELEQLVDVRGITMPAMRRGINKENTEFDALEMDQYGELHTLSRRLAEVALDTREWSDAAQSELNSLDDLLVDQSRQGNETQGAILKMRMVPATTIVGRLQRAVRQASRLLDKEVELTVTGAETLIDSDSLNQLVDPLMHLMRNAVDHGIENMNERTAKGKSTLGHLKVEFGREGNQIVVRCSDDGRGLDYAAIRHAAEARGLIAAGIPVTEAQLTRLILEHGFSTRTEVTQISGRGVGLDVVNSRVHELKGTLDVQSKSNSGCRFVIRLPATLISTHALLVRHGKHTVAVASRGVRQIVDPSAVAITTLSNRLSVRIGDTVYEAHRLETLLGQPLDRRDQERSSRPALLVEISTDRIVAILVQSVVDTIDLVVKPLGAFVPRTAGLVGATILGDGSVVPVMDIPELLRVDERARTLPSSGPSLAPSIESRSNRRETRSMQATLPSVLVVDDSLSVRRSMEQLLRDSGYEVRLARDGLEAVAILEAKKPDILLVDLEMPRMNGMELTVHVRNRAETRDLPVIMITSRSTEKHRKQAQAAGVNHYMTKPYGEDALLERIGACLKHSA